MARTCASERALAHGYARQSRAWLRDGDEPLESPLLPDRSVPRHRGGCAARHRADRHHCHAAADHVRPAAGLRAHHAVGNILWRAIRRVDHRHPDQPARRIVVGGDGTRWLSDGAPGQGRPGTGDGRDRIFHRWKYCDSAGRAVCAAPGGCCASLRSCRVLLADGARPCRFDRAGEWLAAARTRHDRRRSGAGARRHRRQLGHLALQPWLPATGRWHRLCRHRHGYVRPGRNHRQSRKRGDAHRAHQARDRIAAVPRGLAKNSRPDRTGHRAGLGAGHPAGRRCAARFICVLFAREEDLENAGAIRTGRHRRRGRP